MCLSLLVNNKNMSFIETAFQDWIKSRTLKSIFTQFSCSMLGLKETYDLETAILKDCKVTTTTISTTATTAFFCFLLAKAILNLKFFYQCVICDTLQ